MLAAAAPTVKLAPGTTPAQQGGSRAINQALTLFWTLVERLRDAGAGGAESNGGPAAVHTAASGRLHPDRCEWLRWWVEQRGAAGPGVRACDAAERGSGGDTGWAAQRR